MRLFIFSLFITFNAWANLESFSLNSERSLYIVDGDSVSLQMRIAGIDTPELGQKCRKSSVQMVDCGRIAKNHLKRLLRSLPGQLTIEPLGVDHYQRVLVRVYKGGVNIGQLMVESGMAFSYKDTYKQAQDLAKAEQLGFWNYHTPPIEPYKWRKLNRY
ncbi:MAG: thermonuclease family protein [Candidatus Thioglobus sp.]|nr:thermonuclease family protein [Candidatus Thioglobus pontius]MBL6976679.1 thermonuclease family protein [Candidatus Thioglobus sp.]MBL6984528.1 thermonuclease family protein [Candidatus Thioglobus sp.]